MNRKIIALSTVALVGGLLITPKLAAAYQGDPNVQGPNYTAERHDAMTAAFANNDYNAWSQLMQGKGRVTQVINQDNFAQFAKAHALSLEGKTDEANQIRQQLGLGLGNNTRNSSGQGMGQGRNR